MGVVFGLGAAVLYGTGDYLGGRAADGGDVRRVVLVAQMAAFVGAAFAVLVVHGTVRAVDIGYGVGAGVTTALGLGLLYRGLAIGRAGVVAPVTAVVGALVPVTWGELRGERPSALALVGVAVALSAAGLIARGHDDSERERSGIGIAVAAGVVLGCNFVLYAAADSHSGLWPLFAARIVAIGSVGLVIAFARGAVPRVRLTVPQLRLAVVAGTCDVVGTFSLLAGVRTDLAVLVAAATSLAPGFTVVWSWLLQKEHLDRVQVIGVALALVGLAAIAAG